MSPEFVNAASTGTPISEYIERFQQLIAVFGALLAVVATLLCNARMNRQTNVANARLARARHKADAALAHKQRDEELALKRRGLRVGLLAELSVNYDTLIKDKNSMLEHELGKPFLMFTLISISLYHNSIKYLSLLTTKEIEEIVNCYLAIEGHVKTLLTVSIVTDKQTHVVSVSNEYKDDMEDWINTLCEVIQFTKFSITRELQK